jgi:predicted ATPase/DNA-binding CsgD family transcriptional regulator
MVWTMPGQRGVARAGDLPIPLTTFVGRKLQIQEAAERLASFRLLTLVGPGGIGKTRLAQQIASRVGRSGTTTVARWVQLTDLDRGVDNVMLEQTVAEACGIRDFSGESPWDRLVSVLTGGRHLLILDNCEHLAEAVGSLVSDLLVAVPGLRIVATSRQPLGCEGEQQLLVPPLPAREAYTLLTDRTTAAGGVSLDESTRELGELLCQRLDGIPLAIELAAQRLRRMSPDALLAALDDRLKLLTGGSRHGGRTAHSSLRAMVEWSWDLCTPAEQTMWARTSVFAPGAGWDLTAAQEVCADNGEATIADQDVLDILDGLVDKQIVIADTTRPHTRYRLLETVRLYGRDVLRQRGEDAVQRARHSRYYFTRTAEAARMWFGPSEMEFLEWTRIELPNVRSTFESALANPDHALHALVMAANLTRLRIWFFAGTPREGHTWLERALAAVAATYPMLPDERAAGHVLGGHALAGWLALCQGRPADPYLAACRAMVGDSPSPPPMAFLEGAHRVLVLRDPQGIELLAEARQGFAAAGPEFRGDVAMAELIEGLGTSLIRGDDTENLQEQALTVTQRCLDHALASCAPWAGSWARLVRGTAVTWHGDVAKALTMERDTLRWGRAVDDRWGTVWAIHAVAWALAEQLADSDNSQAAASSIAFLLGGAELIRHRTGVALQGLPTFADATAKAAALAMAVLDPDAYATAYQRGLNAAPAAIMATALGEQYEPESPALDSGDFELWDTLTPAEQQVARLAAQGLSNPKIAARRGVSLRTVETQMTAILRGLDILNRHQIASMLPAAETGR